MIKCCNWVTERIGSFYFYHVYDWSLTIHGKYERSYWLGTCAACAPTHGPMFNGLFYLEANQVLPTVPNIFPLSRESSNLLSLDGSVLLDSVKLRPSKVNRPTSKDGRGLSKCGLNLFACLVTFTKSQPCLATFYFISFHLILFYFIFFHSVSFSFHLIFVLFRFILFIYLYIYLTNIKPTKTCNLTY